MADQKTRWANRATKREEWAKSARAQAASLLASRTTDWAFISQPGHIPARAAEIARTDRAMELLAKAKAHEIKAANLSALASRQAGDAEKDRQARRDATAFQVGQRAKSLYGLCEIIKVNAKTVRIRCDNGGSLITVDKSLMRAA